MFQKNYFSQFLVGWFVEKALK